MKSYDELIRERRELLKAQSIGDEEYDSHQRKGVQPPPLEKPYPEDGVLVDLVKPEDIRLGNVPLFEAIKKRESRRKYTGEALMLEELSFLLWSTQGVKVVDKNRVWTKRVVPSGGARHPFETYLIVSRVEGLESGVYRYLAIEHKLLWLAKSDSRMVERVSDACYGQSFVGESAVVFVWAAVPYRAEWRYGVRGYKDVAVEAGHICQNLYLACEAIGAGACAIAAYDQKAVDELIGVDGQEEFTVYLAPVGKISNDKEQK